MLRCRKHSTSQQPPTTRVKSSEVSRESPRRDTKLTISELVEHPKTPALGPVAPYIVTLSPVKVNLA